MLLHAFDYTVPLSLLIPKDVHNLRIGELRSQPYRAESHSIELQQNFRAAPKTGPDEVGLVPVEVVPFALCGHKEPVVCSVRVEQSLYFVEALVLGEVIVNKEMVLVGPKRPDQILA